MAAIPQPTWVSFWQFLTICSAVLLRLSLCNDHAPANQFQVSVDGSRMTQFIDHFWESTGFWWVLSLICTFLQLFTLA